MIDEMPGLRVLDIGENTLPDRPFPHLCLHTFAASFTPLTMAVLARSPTRDWLRSTFFDCTFRNSVPITFDWSIFPKLCTVDMSLGLFHGTEAVQSLASCVTAEHFTLAGLAAEDPLCAILEQHQVLHSLPSSAPHLDLSPLSSDVVNDYILNWIRDSATGWPNLKRIRLLHPKHVVACTFEEREQLVGQCEKVCGERGVALHWGAQM